MSILVETVSLSMAAASSSACLYACITTVGCIFSSRNCCEVPSTSAANTITDVVPSPTSSSWVLAISIIVLAAGCWTVISLRIALPSLVMTIPPIGSINILSMALGPRQVRITSPIVLPALMFSSCTFLPESLLVFWLSTMIGPGPIILSVSLKSWSLVEVNQAIISL